MTDILVIGGGAAGLFFAREAGKRGGRVLVLEKQERLAKKLLMAGGGKANFGNRTVAESDYIGDAPGFIRFALKAFGPEKFPGMLKERGIPIEEREQGRLFCRETAGDILDMLRTECRDAGVRILTGHGVDGVSRRAEGGFLVRSGGKGFLARRLVLASGSPAWPASGADDSGLRLARGLGHRIIPPRPVLTPLILAQDSSFADLAGISVPVRIACDMPGTPEFEDALLFTHKGLSGPAVLQISCYWRKGAELRINFLPDADATALLDAPESGKATPKSLLARHLPERLVLALLPPALCGRKCAELSRAQRAAVHAAIHAHRVTPLRTPGMAQAEACAGGVDTAGVDPRRMESRLVPGLFFCGEILDVAGRLGGYNLHWAWASAHLAARSAVKAPS